MLNESHPSTDPCDTPRNISVHLLKPVPGVVFAIC